MLHSDAESGDKTVEGFVFRASLLAARFLLGLKNEDARQAEPLEATILDQDTSFWKRVSGFLSGSLVVLLPFAGRGQEDDLAQEVADQDVLDRVLFFLPL